MIIPVEPIPDRALVDRQQQTADLLWAEALALEAAGLMPAAQTVFDAAVGLDLLNPYLQYRWGGAFNGQEQRQALFRQILQQLQPAALVETGTYHGITTEFMAWYFSGPIYSCEIDRRCFLGARRRLHRFPQIELSSSDSRAFLNYILGRLAPATPLLVYLDAHWGEDLPLRREIELLLAAGHPAAIMIDDFEVPGDSGYSFDDFGPGKRLCLDLLEFMAGHDQPLFYPKLPALAETGSQRGCVVLSTGDGVTAALQLVQHLRWDSFAAWRRL